jgi:hypothetical protein
VEASPEEGPLVTESQIAGRAAGDQGNHLVRRVETLFRRDLASRSPRANVAYARPTLPTLRPSLRSKPRSLQIERAIRGDEIKGIPQVEERREAGAL